MKIIFGILVGLISGLSIASQDLSRSVENKSVVYVYSRDAPSHIGKLRPIVYMDNKEISRLPEQEYFIAIVEPGTHSFHFDKKKKAGGVEMEFEAGKVYFLRVGWKASMTIKPEGLDPVPREVAAFDLKTTKLISEGEIKNKDVVVLRVP